MRSYMTLDNLLREDAAPAMTRFCAHPWPDPCRETKRPHVICIRAARKGKRLSPAVRYPVKTSRVAMPYRW